MPDLRGTARSRRTAAAAHDGSRPERRAALRRPLSALWRVCPFRRSDGKRDGVPRVGLPRARTSAQRSTPRPDRAPESARLARRPRLSAFDEVSFEPRRPASGPEGSCRNSPPWCPAVPRLRGPWRRRPSQSQRLENGTGDRVGHFRAPGDHLVDHSVDPRLQRNRAGSRPRLKHIKPTEIMRAVRKGTPG